MRVCFAFAAVAVLSVAGVAFSGEVGEDGLQSVLVKKEATAVETAPCKKSKCVCSSGCCDAGPQLYNVESSCEEHCRNRLFGGKVVRKSSRTVYKPVRR